MLTFEHFNLHPSPIFKQSKFFCCTLSKTRTAYDNLGTIEIWTIQKTPAHIKVWHTPRLLFNVAVSKSSLHIVNVLLYNPTHSEQNQRYKLMKTQGLWEC